MKVSLIRTILDMSKTIKKSVNFLSYILFSVFILSANVYAEENYNKEVSSINEIVDALYHSISGEKGEPRNWKLFHHLFTENAQLIPTGRNKEGKINIKSWSPKMYQERVGKWLVDNGFQEIEINKITERYGPIVHVFSTYESRKSKKDKKPFTGGINSIQLFHDGERWWVVNVFWAMETPENPIPEKYLAQ